MIRPNCVLRPPSKTSSPTMPGKRLVQMYSVVTVSVCGGRRVGGGTVGVMHHFLPFVCFALY